MKVRRVLLALAIAVVLCGVLAKLLLPSQHGRPVQASNERRAAASLRTIAFAQANFRDNDRDGNGRQDYWAGDVASLYTLKDLKLIELGVAEADAAPLKPAPAKVMSGYLYAVVPERADGSPLGVDTDRDGRPDRDAREFAVCAWPADYEEGGAMTFLVNQEGAIWRKDTGRGARLLRWPKNPAAEGWIKLD